MERARPPLRQNRTLTLYEWLEPVHPDSNQLSRTVHGSFAQSKNMHTWLSLHDSSAFRKRATVDGTGKHHGQRSECSTHLNFRGQHLSDVSARGGCCRRTAVTQSRAPCPAPTSTGVRLCRRRGTGATRHRQEFRRRRSLCRTPQHRPIPPIGFSCTSTTQYSPSRASTVPPVNYPAGYPPERRSHGRGPLATLVSNGALERRRRVAAQELQKFFADSDLHLVTKAGKPSQPPPQPLRFLE